MHTRNDIKFPDFTKFVHEYLQKNLSWIWLCFCHLEYFINPEKDIRNHFETAIKSTVGRETPHLWLFFLEWTAKNAPGDIFSLLQRFIASNSQTSVLIPVIRKYLIILDSQQARDLIESMVLSRDPKIAFYCASIFWNNEQFLKCGACLKPIIDSGIANEESYKLFIAGNFNESKFSTFNICEVLKDVLFFHIEQKDIFGKYKLTAYTLTNFPVIFPVFSFNPTEEAR